MRYGVAFRIGWSFVWRRALWMAALTLVVAPVVVLTRMWERPEGFAVLASAVLAIEAFVIHPLVVQALPRIRYHDFHLAIYRPDHNPSDLTYADALLISLVPTVLIALCEALALFRGFFFGLVVLYPAAAWLMTYPWKRCRLEVVETEDYYGPAIG